MPVETADKKTMAWSVVGNVWIVVHGKSPPTDKEWDAYLDYGQNHVTHANRTLVLSDGGGPNAVQRKKTSDSLQSTKGKNVKVAVCTDDMVVRGIVTALSWFNATIKAFPRQKVTDALTFLGVETAAFGRIIAEATKLRASIPD